MWNYLGFPSEYQVAKHMGKERYLRLANLTPAEQKRLQAYLHHIEVLYAIPFADKSEIVVLMAEIDAGNRRDKFYLTNLTNAVASSFPYLCLLVVRCEGVIKFFIFDERDNARDAGRSVVFGRYATSDIPMGNEDYFANQFLLELRQSVQNASTAKELHSLWWDAIVKSAGGVVEACTWAEMNTFDWTNRDRAIDFERSRIFDESISLDEATLTPKFDYEDEFDEDELDDKESYERYSSQVRPSEGILSDVYDGRSLDEDEPAEMLFVEFCANNARPLYREYGDTFASEQEWLITYVDICNRYAEALFNKVLPSSAILQIKSTFIEDENSNSCEYSDEYDVDELIEMISPYIY